MKSIKILALFQVSFFLFVSCSLSTQINGVVTAVNVDIPEGTELDLVMFDAVNSETYHLTSTMGPDGSFSAKVKQDGALLIFIDVKDDKYSLSSNWLQNHPIEIVAGKKIEVRDLYLAIDFPLEITNVSSQISSINDIELKWNKIEIADYYAVYVIDEKEEDSLRVLLATKDSFYKPDETVKLIPFDIKMTASEITLTAPFFRKNEAFAAGSSTIHVAAIKEIQDDLEMIIARSERVSIP